MIVTMDSPDYFNTTLGFAALAGLLALMAISAWYRKSMR